MYNSSLTFIMKSINQNYVTSPEPGAGFMARLNEGANSAPIESLYRSTYSENYETPQQYGFTTYSFPQRIFRWRTNLDKDNGTDSIKDKPHKKSISLESLLDNRNNEPTLALAIKNGVSVTSLENAEMAQLLSNLIKVSFVLQKRSGDDLRDLRKSYRTRNQIADAKALEIYPLIKKFESEGLDNDNLIAAALTKAEILTPSGKNNWQHVTVKRIRDRVEKLNVNTQG